MVKKNLKENLYKREQRKTLKDITPDQMDEMRTVCNVVRLIYQMLMMMLLILVLFVSWHWKQCGWVNA